MRVFNAFQITTLFAGFPFLINYLSDASFRGAGAVFYLACAAYVVAFVYMCFCVAENIKG